MLTAADTAKGFSIDYADSQLPADELAEAMQRQQESIERDIESAKRVRHGVWAGGFLR